MISGFFIGLVGSFHCIGMCSPIMMSLTKGAGNLQTFAVYHLSRIIIYMLFGVFIGMLGAAFSIFAYQQTASIIAGVLLIAIYGFPRWRNKVEGFYYRSAFYNKVKGFFIPLYQSKLKWLAAGMLNGLLPCGLIYLALAGAMLQGGIFHGSMYMMSFGLGTVPALATLSFFRGRMNFLTKKLPNATTFISLTAGLIMVLRGVLIQAPNLNELITSQITNAITYCGF
ncbi:MAG: sulfite exporter TauE/SafE family protein [Cyclobacteriaceae bacterium]